MKIFFFLFNFILSVYHFEMYYILHIPICVILCSFNIEFEPLKQGSPTFLTSGTGFVQDGFFTDQGGRRMVSGWFKHSSVHAFTILCVLRAESLPSCPTLRPHGL